MELVYLELVYWESVNWYNQSTNLPIYQFTNLPIIILLIPQLHQQVSRNLLEYLFMFIGEMFLPLTGLAGAEGRGFCRVDGGFEGVEDQLSGRLKRNTAEEVVHDRGESRGSSVDQILEVNCQNLFSVEPAEIRFESVCDVREFDPGIGSSKNADLEPRIEIRQGLVIVVMHMPRFHIGDVKDVRDDHIARVAENEIRREFCRADAGNGFGSGKEMRRCNVTRAQRIEPGKCFFGFALFTAFAFVLGVKRMHTPGVWRNACKAEQDLVQQVCAAFGKGNAQQGGQIGGRRSKTKALQSLFSVIDCGTKERFQHASI